MSIKVDNAFIEKTWDDSIVPSISEYIKIPNKSPAYDADWEKNGYMDQAVNHIANWCRENGPKDMTLEIIKEPGVTPLIYMDIPGDVDNTVMLYGHLDKQPEMVGWDEDLGPWKPVLKGDKLYGRGGADDGYSAYAAITAINALKKENTPHGRCIILIEASEESGSNDLATNIAKIKHKMGEPELVVCLDSGAGNYNQIWVTTSLRGCVTGDLKVEVLKEGVHSGTVGGVAPNTFRILRQLLSRIEDEKTGEILLDSTQVDIPTDRKKQAVFAADVLGDGVISDIPFANHFPVSPENYPDILLQTTWRAALAITGVTGLPDVGMAGNVLVPETTVKISLRIPPVANPSEVLKELKEMLEKDAPNGANVSFTATEEAAGWDSPPVSPWLQASIDEASNQYYGKSSVFFGEGGTIPFMGMLGEEFPKAQFFITGVLGPKSNAHGPNEFLHIPMGKKITSCVAYVLASHYKKVKA